MTGALVSKQNLCSSLPHSMLLLLALLLDNALLPLFLEDKRSNFGDVKNSCGLTDAPGSDVASYGSGKAQNFLFLPHRDLGPEIFFKTSYFLGVFVTGTLAILGETYPTKKSLLPHKCSPRS